MRAKSWAILPLALALAAGVVLATPVTTWRPRADEGYYLLYATRVAEQGPGAFPDLFREYLADPLSRQLFPSPIRVTAILLGALAIRLGGPGFPSLAHLSLAAFLVLLGLVFLGGRRLVGPRTAAATTLLLAASPLQLAMARRALSDSLNATLLIGCLALCIAAVTAERPAPRRWWAVAAAYAVAFLGRELNLVLIPLSLVLIAGFTLWHRRPLPIGPACWVSVVPLAIAALAAALAAGGFVPAWRAFTATVLQPGQNVYALQYGGGPWFRYLLDYLLLSPWTTVLYLAWLGQLAVGAAPTSGYGPGRSSRSCSSPAPRRGRSSSAGRSSSTPRSAWARCSRYSVWCVTGQGTAGRRSGSRSRSSPSSRAT